MSSPCTISDHDGVSVIEFGHETQLDALTVEAIQADVYALVESAKAPRMLLDMENVSFISSRGLGFLLALRVKAARAGSELALAGLRRPLFELFKVTQLDQLYAFYPTRGEAIQMLRA